MAYSRSEADRVCALLATGISLRTIHKDHMGPAPSTFLDWVREHHEDLAEQYTRALQDRHEILGDAILDVADDPTIDPQDKRIRVDARKWILARMLPKKYGDRRALEVSGPEGGPVPLTAVDLVKEAHDGDESQTDDEG